MSQLLFDMGFKFKKKLEPTCRGLVLETPRFFATPLGVAPSDNGNVDSRMVFENLETAVFQCCPLGTRNSSQKRSVKRKMK